MTEESKLKLLVFVVAYNAEKTIAGVLNRLPEALRSRYDVEVLIIDDCSNDKTFEIAMSCMEQGFWCDVTVLRNPVNQGYGGNQKIGYHYAIKNGFDVVALLHGDGQYAPEYLPTLAAPFSDASPPAAVFGSRVMDGRSALKGGMPLYKYAGNRILTRIQNLLLSSGLSEFHSGYRLYSTKALQAVPFDLNTNDFHFDTEIIVQMLFSGSKIVELPIPTHYGDEVCHVNGIQYAANVIRSSTKALLMNLGIFFDPKFDVKGPQEQKYVNKLDFASTHRAAYEAIQPQSVVLDLGCSEGHLSERLAADKNCEVFSTDLTPSRSIAGCNYQMCDLNKDLPDVPWESLDTVVLLDVIEHLYHPEDFLRRLREKLSPNRKVQVIVSSGNVCFFVTRFMMFLGQFNYGKRGILDMTHTRLFNGKTLKRLFRYASYNVLEKQVIPAPYPLAIGLNPLSKLMLRVNYWLARVMPGLFAYQVMLKVQPNPGVDWLLEKALDSRLREVA
jgi:glycosyltransferase involved in cell wall biosynthesis